MSTSREESFYREEEEMVERVGGRGRGLVQAVLRLKRERAGRAPQNLEQRTPNWTIPVLQEVGPHGQEEERRLKGLQAWGRRNGIIDSGPRTNDTEDDGQQTVPKETHDRPRSRVWARPSTPLPHPGFPMIVAPLLLGCFMAPHRCPHCNDIPDNVFPLPPYSVTDPDPLPHCDDLLPPGYTPFLTPMPTYVPVSLHYLPLPSP